MKIEYSNQGGKFSPSELRSKVAESKAYWQSPEGKRKAAQLDVERRNRKPAPTRFPKLAKQGTQPIMTALEWRRRLLDLI